MRFSVTLPLLSIFSMVNAQFFPRPALALLNEDPIFETPITKMLRGRDRMIDQAFSSLSYMPENINFESNNNYPQFKVVTNNDKEFNVAIDVPGMKMDDIQITLENDNKVLVVSGLRESKGDGYFFGSKFSQRFSLDATVVIDRLSAHLENEVLIITAPKDLTKSENNNIRRIPITMSSLPSTENKGNEEKFESTLVSDL